LDPEESEGKEERELEKELTRLFGLVLVFVFVGLLTFAGVLA